jgi:prepilin-type N-terminal cleavage/methylation domain-containing protein
MKMLHSGQKGFTLIELLIVVAILGIIAAVIIPNIGTFMTMGTVSAANSEAENVKTASLAYYADAGVWPDTTSSTSGNYSFIDYYAGTLKASYHFDDDGFLDGVNSPGEVPTDSTTTSDQYNGIHWENPTPPDVGHGQWVRD